MKKLIVTLIGHENEIESAWENIKDTLGNCPYDLKTTFKIKEVEYSTEQRIVVQANNSEDTIKCFPSYSFENAILYAKEVYNNSGHAINPNNIEIYFADVRLIEGEFEYVIKKLHYLLKGIGSII